jgi:hypothetical protein
MSDRENYSMDGEIRGFSDLLEDSGQKAGEVQFYEDVWGPEPPPFDPDRVYTLPDLSLDLSAPIMVDTDKINVDDLVNAKPGSIIRCTGIPAPLIRVVTLHPLEADWNDIWSKATHE